MTRAGRVLIPILLSSLACRPTFETVDEACSDRVGGSRHAHDLAEALVSRVNCHRRVARIGRLSFHPDVQGAAANQADAERPLELTETLAYLQDNNYPPSLSSNFALWSMYAGIDSDSSTDSQIDVLIASPYFRQVMLQTSARHIGLEPASDRISMVVTFDYPPIQRMNRPVVYPVDGQIQVPTTWLTRFDGVDGIPSGEVGYPITVAVSGDDAQPFGTRDPLRSEVGDYELIGPDGPVELVLVEPRTTAVLLMFTSAFVPLEPLEPDTEYTFSARIAWNTGSRDVESTFRTAP